jgi:hypothetical protein
MGKISQGVLGGFSGKVGNVVGGTWKGIDYMRIKPSNVSNPRTVGQLDQRSKFALVLNFLQPMTDFLRVGFKNYAKKQTQFNAAMSYNLLNGVSGAYPNYAIDFSKALVTRGGLIGAVDGRIDSPAPETVDFTWADNTGSGAQSNDKALLLIYNPTKGFAIYETEGADRESGAQTLSVPADFSGDDVEGFIGFISEDGKTLSNSVYVGSIAVA